MNPVNMRIASAGLETARPQNTGATAPVTSFREVLNGQVQFSKHAALRLDTRDIKLSDEQVARLATGIGKADEKGIRDSLVLVDNVALVVNVKSRTVITAISQHDNRHEAVFSNIDGAVIA
jgi:flagellar operon protein